MNAEAILESFIKAENAREEGEQKVAFLRRLRLARHCLSPTGALLRPLVLPLLSSLFTSPSSESPFS
jgi:hypothetical protein